MEEVEICWKKLKYAGQGWEKEKKKYVSRIVLLLSYAFSQFAEAERGYEHMEECWYAGRGISMLREPGRGRGSKQNLSWSWYRIVFYLNLLRLGEIVRL